MSYRIAVDREVCMSSGKCVADAPELFRFDDEEVAERGHHEVLVCVSAESREQVDDLVDRAVAAGGSPVRKDEGGDVMYGRSYADLDGHIWEVMWMDVAAFEAGGEIA